MPCLEVVCRSDEDAVLLCCVTSEMTSKTEVRGTNFVLVYSNISIQYTILQIVFDFSSVGPSLRLYCDICDVYDAHDTEDCPQQEM